MTEDEPGPEEDLSLPVHPELVEWAKRLRHDLGKYITMQQRWLAPGASIEERYEALIADVVETRRSTQKVVDAFHIWAEFRSIFSGEVALSDGTAWNLLNDEDLVSIEMNLEILAGVLRGLSGGGRTPVLLKQGEEATRAISGACRSFSRRIQRRDTFGVADV